MRGHHVYKSVWTPVGEELNLEHEESNEHDEYAVAVRKNGETVRQRIQRLSTLKPRQKTYAVLYYSTSHDFAKPTR